MILDITPSTQKDALRISFDVTPKVSDISLSKFELWTTDATPVQFTDPFFPIALSEDYNSISRQLYLALKQTVTLEPTVVYRFYVKGLKNAAGVVQPDAYVDFTVADEVTGEVTEPIPDPIIVEDKSVKVSSLTDINVLTSSLGGLFVESTDPSNGDYYLDGDYGSGRITIEFSESPATFYLNSKYIKAQRKPMKWGPSRWESVSVEVSTDSVEPWVYVDFPSNDATPVYAQPGHTYFETNYKYRVIVSKKVST